MIEFFYNHTTEFLSSAICIAALLILKFIATKAIRKVGKISDLNAARTRLIIKYVSIGLTAIGIILMFFFWGVNIKELGVILSSVFAVIGVALFASWSILSNITAGVILFFSFPFKIGDRIRIYDSDIKEEAIIIDIKAFHLYLRSDNGELITYPNNLILQKGVALIQKDAIDDIDPEENF